MFHPAPSAASPVIGTFSPDVRPRNHLLRALPPAELELLRPHLELVQWQQRDLVYDAGAPIHYVHFPETAVLSNVSVLAQGGTVEVGTAGREGMVGLPVFLGDHASTHVVFAQVPGLASRIETKLFLGLTTTPGAFHRVMLRYTRAFFTQVVQTAACNAAHLVEERCARWLLTTHDRVDGADFPLTHELLAYMLGVRRAGVTVAMGALQDAGLVHTTRGRIAIADRAGLERASCECYHVVRAHFERLLPRAA